MKLQTLLESDTQTHKRLQFIRASVNNIQRTLRQIDWSKATENEKRDVKGSIQRLVQIIK